MSPRRRSVCRSRSIPARNGITAKSAWLSRAPRLIPLECGTDHVIPRLYGERSLGRGLKDLVDGWGRHSWPVLPGRQLRGTHQNRPRARARAAAREWVEPAERTRLKPQRDQILNCLPDLARRPRLWLPPLRPWGRRGVGGGG